MNDNEQPEKIPNNTTNSSESLENIDVDELLTLLSHPHIKQDDINQIAALPPIEERVPVIIKAIEHPKISAKLLSELCLYSKIPEIRQSATKALRARMRRQKNIKRTNYHTD